MDGFEQLRDMPIKSQEGISHLIPTATSLLSSSDKLLNLW